MRTLCRIGRVIALSGVVAFLGCDDATAPDENDHGAIAQPSLPPADATPLGRIGLTLIDATSWVFSSINDTDKRSQMQSTLEELAEHLTTGAYDAARSDVTKARVLRASLDAIDGSETGPIEIALDETDAALREIDK